MSTINHNVAFFAFLSVSEVHRRLQALTSSRLDRDQDGGGSPATLHLQSAMGNDTLSETPSHFVRVAALCDWSSLVASEQWDSQRQGKCKRRPPGRTFQTPVQARANKVSVTLAQARRLFLLLFFLFPSPLSVRLCVSGEAFLLLAAVYLALPFSMSLTLRLSPSLDFIMSLSLCRMSLFFFCHFQIRVSPWQPLLKLIRTTSAIPASTNTLLSMRQTRLLCCWCNYVTIYFHCVSLPTLGC